MNAIKEIKVKVIEVIQTITVEGEGTDESPMRTVSRYWRKNGRLIGEELDIFGDEDEGSTIKVMKRGKRAEMPAESGIR